jgi:hypothetical protein
MSDKELHDRIKLMMMKYAHDAGHATSNAAFGKAVAQAERVAPYSATDVQDWIDGTCIPAFSTLMAIGRTAGYDEDNELGYLAFGNDLLIHELTAEEYGLVYRHRKIASANAKAP